MTRLPNITTMLPWSAIKTVGGKPCRIGFPTPRFWNLWNADKPGVKRMGIEVKKDESSGAFVAYWWNPPADKAPTRQDVPELKFDPEALPESIRSKLRPYQVEPTLMAIHAVQTFPHAFLNAFGCGAGKTYSAVATALALGMRIAAISRLSAFPAWKEVSEYFGYKEILLLNREKLRTGNTPYVKFVERHEAGKSWKEWEWTLPENHLLIFDEVHGDSGISSTQGEILCAAARQRLPMLLLSATAADEPSKMRAIGYALGLHNLDDFYAWMYRNGCQKIDGGFTFNFGYTRLQVKNNALIRQDVERKRVEIMGALHNELKAKGRIVRLKTTEIPGFPKTQVIPVALDFDEDQIQSIYKEMQEELDRLRAKMGIIPNGELKKVPAVMTILMRARQKTELLKIPGIVEEVEQIIDEGGSCPIFLNFTESVQALAKRLKSFNIFDGNNLSDRDAILKAYQRDDQRHIIFNSSAGSESISCHDLHGNYPRTALVMPSFFANMVKQITGRICRDGGKTPSISKILFASGTVEEHAYKSCCRRMLQVGAFNGDTITDEDLMAGIRL